MTAPTSTPPVTTRVRTYRAIGAAAVATTTVIAAALADRYPWLTAVNTAVAWWVGKLLGVPLDAVVQAALAAMKPDRAVMVAVDALRSLPPEQAEDATRTLLRSIPPVAAQRVVGGVRLVNVGDESLPTAPPPAGKPDA